MRFYWKSSALAILTVAISAGCGGSGGAEVPAVGKPDPKLEQQVLQQIQQRQNQGVAQQPAAPAPAPAEGGQQ